MFKFPKQEGVVKAVITPEIAKKLLSLQIKNKKLRPKQVAVYADLMKEGKWKVNNGQKPTIMISKANDNTLTYTLVNGIHRMNAVIAANKPVLMKIDFEEGDPRDVKDTIDIGPSRSLADLLEMDSVPNSRVVASSLGWIYALYHNSRPFEGTRSRQKLKEYFDNEIDKNRLQESIKLIHRLGKSKEFSLPWGVFIGSYYVLSGINFELANDFFEQLLVGEDLSKGMPTFAFRSILSRHSKIRGIKFSAESLFNFLLQTWNYYISGTTIANFKLSSGMKRIQPYGIDGELDETL